MLLHLYVYNAVGPKVPVIDSDSYWMDNWNRFVFTWRHDKNDFDTVTDYYAWFRNRFV